MRAAATGALGEPGVLLAQLFRSAHERATDDRVRGEQASEQAARLEREANALAAVVADLLVAARGDSQLASIVDAVVNDLPWDARQRVNAYRHQRSGFTGARPYNSEGQQLPDVPPRASVMRQAVRVVDVQVVDTRGALAPSQPDA